MRLSVRILGLDLLDVELTTEQQQDDDLARDLSGGTTASVPMGFVARMDKPHEIDTPDRDW